MKIIKEKKLVERIIEEARAKKYEIMVTVNSPTCQGGMFQGRRAIQSSGETA